MRLLYGTSNPGKLMEVGRFLRLHGIDMMSPSELGLELDPEESGTTLEENAVLKVHAYQQILPSEVAVFTDDTGVEIDALNGEPGIYVRRWKDKKNKMTDQEIIEYTIERMQGIPLEKRGAQMRTVIAYGAPDGQIELFDGVLRGHIVEQPANFLIEGFPYECLFFATDYNMMLGEMHQLPDEKKIKFTTHRERAVEKLAKRLTELDKSQK